MKFRTDQIVEVYRHYLNHANETHKVPREIIFGVIKTFSEGDPFYLDDGSVGLMGVTNEMAALYCANFKLNMYHLPDYFGFTKNAVETNIAIGTWYLKMLMNMENNLEDAIRIYFYGDDARRNHKIGAIDAKQVLRNINAVKKIMEEKEF